MPRRAPELVEPRRARPPPRAAAPGAAAHGHQARALAQPAPARPTPRAVRRTAPRADAAPAGSSVDGGLRRDRPRRRRLRLRQRVAPPPRAPRALRARRPARHLRRVAGLHGRRRLRPARAVAVRRLGRGAGARAGTRRSTGHEVDDDWWRVHPGRAPAGRPRPSRSATSATTRPTPSPAGPAPGCRPRPSGRRSPAGDAGRRAATSSTRARLHPRPAGPGPAPLFGDVWEWTSERLQPLSRASARRPGAVGEYNGKFMVNQIRAAGRLVRHPARPRPGHLPQLLPAVGAAGPSPASGWPATSDQRQSSASTTARGASAVPSTSSPTVDCTCRRPRRRNDVRSGLTADPKCLPPVWFYDDRGQPSCSTRSPGCPSTTRPAPSARSSTTTPRRSPRGRAPTPWSSSAPAPATRPGSCSTPCSCHRTAAALRAARRQRRHPVGGGAGIWPRSTPAWPCTPWWATSTTTSTALPRGGRRLVAFLGGTIGNLDPDQRRRFLFELADCSMATATGCLLGTDLVKDRTGWSPPTTTAPG